MHGHLLTKAHSIFIYFFTASRLCLHMYQKETQFFFSEIYHSNKLKQSGSYSAATLANCVLSHLMAEIPYKKGTVTFIRSAQITMKLKRDSEIIFVL